LMATGGDGADRWEPGAAGNIDGGVNPWASVLGECDEGGEGGGEPIDVGSFVLTTLADPRDDGYARVVSIDPDTQAVRIVYMYTKQQVVDAMFAGDATDWKSQGRVGSNDVLPSTFEQEMSREEAAMCLRLPGRRTALPCIRSDLLLLHNTNAAIMVLSSTRPGDPASNAVAIELVEWAKHASDPTLAQSTFARNALEWLGSNKFTGAEQSGCTGRIPFMPVVGNPDGILLPNARGANITKLPRESTTQACARNGICAACGLGRFLSCRVTFGETGSPSVRSVDVGGDCANKLAVVVRWARGLHELRNWCRRDVFVDLADARDRISMFRESL